MNFSIIICAYNPDDSIFARLITAVSNVTIPGDSSVELILVDNNSDYPIADTAAIKKLGQSFASISTVIEKRAGLTYARIAGISAAKYEWIVFFDDDNEPDPNYLVAAKEANQLYPEVGCWGPGRINVIFTTPVHDSWILNNKLLFQERAFPKAAFSCEIHWQDCYPYGTGLTVRRDILHQYATRVKNKQYTLSDRQGKSLASGGDVQIVFTGIEMGYAAGVYPGIKVNHLIEKKKANNKYIRKMVYGTASSYVLAFNQVYPGEPIQSSFASNKKIASIIYSTFRIYYHPKRRKDFWIRLVQKLGETNGHNLAVSSKKPFLLRIFERLINV